ncbi:MAG: MoCo/4Fe-4S cofactor protein with predicted Tat translocation signal [Bradymonadia bacterium]|jgi:MoCo/4Fe-4S cofactor protein with predicted Tat translocation signal
MSPMSDNTKQGMNDKTYWRSLSEKSGGSAWEEHAGREFPPQADELEVDGVSRRGFLGLMGASAALAGVGEGCIRKPAQYILPYTQRPEMLVPGEARHYASSLSVGGDVIGVIVTSTDGRPTKIEGNPAHPSSLGATTAFAQGSILDLYDGGRARLATINGRAASLSDALEAAASTTPGAGTAVLVNNLDSPSLNAKLADLARNGAAIYAHGADLRPSQRDALIALTGEAPTVYADLAKAKVMVTLSADPLHSGPHSIAHARGYAQGRAEGRKPEMNRHYAIESHFTITGMNCDDRLQLPPSQVSLFAKALAKHIAAATDAPGGLIIGSASVDSPSDRFAKWVEVVGNELLANRGTSAVFAGETQPAWVHGLVAWINRALENSGETIFYTRRSDHPETGTLAELQAAVSAGRVQNLIVVDGNPVYDAPVDVEFGALMERVTNTVHASYSVNETSVKAKVHIPLSHPLETWGDWTGATGDSSIQQPLVEPLFESVSPLELLASLTGDEPNGYDLVRAHWQTASRGPNFDNRWADWLHSGVVGNSESARPLTWSWGTALSTMVGADVPGAPTSTSLEVVFALDNTIYDGRFAANPWLQELPDSVSKLTWDNAALVGPATARALNIGFDVAADGTDMLRMQEALETESDVPIAQYGRLDAELATITVGGRAIEIPIMVVPGVAENTLLLPLGYGRTVAGLAGLGAGFNTYTVRAADALSYATGVTFAKAGGTYRLASTQDHNALEGRAIYREGTADRYAEEPDFVDSYAIMDASKLNSLWDEPNERGGQQWGMAIDLTTCIGCNACTIACQAENNISVVGKERVLEGREMHWIRLDRYFSGPSENPEVAVQPVACMHCENAPCEQVCPVAATVHGPQGTNDMAYNRCIGTRYCANNCPYKVRRFNFFNFSRENDDRNDLYRLQKNPNVTVRFRGVMEKCSYCIQRVSAATIAAKVNRPDGVIQDGAITPACGQACPAGAIVFGDINDENSRVSRRKADARNYGMLDWLNVHPRTTYIARITNPNPELA